KFSDRISLGQPQTRGSRTAVGFINSKNYNYASTMSTSLFGIPVDIQWKRLCFSQDMCAKDLDTYPEKWRSSLAVFYNDVTPDPNDTSDELTMYLKVVISITGFQPEGPDIDATVQHKSAWGSSA